MQSRKPGLVLAALAVVGAVVLFVLLRDDGSDPSGSPATTTAPQVSKQGSGNEPRGQQPNEPTIVVRGAEPVGGAQELTFEKGDRIRFLVKSNVTDEVHLHGYDIAKDVEAGGSVRFDVPASIEGVFEVELEERVVPLAEVTVNP